MRYIRLIFIALTIILITANLTKALTITATPTRPVWDDAGTLKINPGMQTTIEFWAEFTEGDETRMAWSSPFLFYGTGVQLSGPGGFIEYPEFNEFWDMSLFHPNNYAHTMESWDGDLTNIEPGGDRPGDLFNFTGVDFNPPHLPSNGSMHIFDIVFPGVTGWGNFCIDIGDFINNTYDWLWDPPAPSFDPVCWPVEVCPCGFIEFVNCPDTNIVISWNDTLVMNFQTLSWINYNNVHTILSDSTGRANLIITDATNDPNGEVQFIYTPNADDVGPNPILIGVYQYMNYYPTGYECTLDIEVHNDPPIMYGQCRRILSVSYEGTDTLHNFTSVDPDAPDSAITYEVFCDSAVGTNANDEPCDCEPYSSYSIDSNGYFKYIPDSLDEGCINYFTVRATDFCGGYSECWVGMVDIAGSCGDPNDDGLINIFDVTFIITYLYLDGPPPDPLESADVNNDGAVNIFDVAHLISYLYLGGPPPLCP